MNDSMILKSHGKVIKVASFSRVNSICINSKILIV
jgi:hypothetical protein